MLSELKENSTKWLLSFCDVHNKEVKFSEPLSDKTFAHKKILLILSLTQLIVVVFKISPSSLAFIDTKAIDVRITSGVLFLVIAYQLAQFFLSFLADRMSHSFEVSLFRSRDAMYANQQLHNSFEHLYLHLASMQNQLADLTNSTEHKEYYRQVDSKLIKTISNIDNVLSGNSIHDNGVRGILEDFNFALSEMDKTERWRAIKWIVTYFIDFAIPILIAVLAIYLSYENAWYVLSEIFSYVQKTN
ncbi:hypothetical protein QXB71_000614 [Vibrio cholerae]|nr:hypothetical protein [Vibrio cholerae]